MGFLDWIPVVGDILDPILGFADTISTNSTNKDIANKNVEQSERTNEWNYKMSQETNQSNRDINAATNLANQQIASAYNANQVRLQNDMNYFNKEMWDLNNRYNSPSAQLARARDAGINPNIVFGQPVAASPVQQTSIPNQALAQMTPYYNQSFKADASKSDYKAQAKGLRDLGRALSSFGRLPFVKEQLDLLKEEVRGKRTDNDTKEYELQGRKDADAFFGGNAYYTATDGSDRVLTADEFDRLSDDDKKAFLDRDTPYVTINGESKPNYNAHQLPFRNKATFEAYKEVQALPNFIQNVRADRVQNELRQYVAQYQISAKDSNGNRSVIYALAHMPQAQFNNLQETLSRLKKENKWSDDTRDLRYHLLELNEKQLQNAVDNDLKTWIDKIGNKDMSWTDWLKMALVVAATFR